MALGLSSGSFNDVFYRGNHVYLVQAKTIPLVRLSMCEEQ
jgi:hypothetical protein